MKRFLTISMLTLALGGTVALFAADPAPAKKEEKKPAATQPATKPFNAKCAVMKDDDVDPKVTYVYKGKVYGFCCKDCIDEFKKNPEKYKDAK